MSVKAMGWAYDQRGIKPVTKAVLVAIANIADEEGYCWPSMKRIAAMVEISVRSAQRHVQDLEVRGLLAVERERHRETGAVTSNAYRLPMAARQLPLLLQPGNESTPPDKLTQGGDTATRGGGDRATRGPHDTAVTPYELPLEQPLQHPTPIGPEWLPPEWAEFLADRRERKKPMTSRAQKLAIERLADLRAAGHDPAAVIRQSIENTWSAFYPVRSMRAGRESVEEANRRTREELRRREAQESA